MVTYRRPQVLGHVAAGNCRRKAKWNLRKPNGGSPVAMLCVSALRHTACRKLSKEIERLWLLSYHFRVTYSLTASGHRVVWLLILRPFGGRHLYALRDSERLADTYEPE